MSKAKNAATGKSPDLKKISATVVKQIWNQIDFQDWKAIVETARPDGRWKGTNDGLKGACPFHEDSDPSFVIDLQRGHAKCFSSECGKFFWDPIRFYAAIQPFPLSYPNALKEMKDRYDIKVPKNAIAGINKRWEHRQMKRVLYEVMNGELCDAYTYLADPNPAHPPPPDITYAKDALLYLQRRDIKPVYHCLPIGIMPTRLKLEQRVREYAQVHQDKDYWQMADEYLSDIDSSWIGSLVFFTGDSPDDPCKLKFRKIPLPNVPKDDKSIQFVVDSYEENNGIFGLFGTRTLLPVFASRDIKKFHFFEGEFDVLSVLSRQIENSQLGFLPFSGGGSSSSGLDAMGRYGFDTGYIVGDWDKAGEDWPKTILESTIKLNARIFRWPESMRVPDKPNVDPDLAVRVHGLAAFEAEMRKEENFQMPHTWAFSRAKKELSDIDQDDVRQLTAKASKWGAYVRNPAERQAFITSVCSHFKIVNAGQIHSAIDRGDDNEEAFIERIHNALKHRFQVLEKTRDRNSFVLRVWDKRTEEVVDLPIGEKHRVLSAIEAMAGKDLYRWIYDDVGEPGHLLPFEEAKEANMYVAQAKKLIDYVVMAVSRLGGSAIPGLQPRQIGQGFHVVRPAPGEKDQPFRGYLVNGTDLYRGDYTAEGVSWTACDGPLDERVRIHLGPNRRPGRTYPQIRGVLDLQPARGMSVAELYESVREMVDAGWHFKNQSSTVDLVTGFVLLVSISDVASRQPLLMFSASRSSGKTSLIGGLIGGHALPAINIVQCAVSMDSYTPAGIRQKMEGARLCLCLDEFEDDGSNSKKAVAVRGTQTLLRGLANEASSVFQGTVSGIAREVSLRFPIAVAAIRPPMDPADVSRYIMNEMDRRIGRENPEATLLNRFGNERIAEIRDALPITMLNHAYKVWLEHNAIKEEYRDGAGLPPAGRETRTREQLYGIMAIMRVAGRDERRFAERFFKGYQAHALRISTTTLSASLFSAIFYAQIRIADHTGTRETNVAALVRERETGVLFGKGVAYDPETNWLFVHWPAAKQSLLLRSKEFSQLDSGALMQHASRSERHVPADDVLWSEEGRNVTLPAGATPEQMSVFSLDKLIDPSKATKGIEVPDLTPEEEVLLTTATFPKPAARTGGGHHGTGN